MEFYDNIFIRFLIIKISTQRHLIHRQNNGTSNIIFSYNSINRKNERPSYSKMDIKGQFFPYICGRETNKNFIW